MELINKFKNSDAGKIPFDWDLDLLENVTNVIDPHPSHRAPKSVSNGIPFFGIGDLNVNGEVIKKNFRRVNEQIFTEHKLRYNLNKNLIGLGRVASIGKVIKLKNNIGIYTLSPTLGVLDSKGINNDYLYYILSSAFIKNYFGKIMSGSTRSSVGMIVLRKIPIPLPPLDEQKAIAKVLSDTDNLIQALEQKLAKKRAIKQGAMQHLLTPKEDWEVKTLGELATMSSGGTPLSNVGEYYNGDILWVSISDISKAGKYISNSAKKITEKGLINSSARIFPKNVVLLAMYASIGKCCIAIEEVTTSQAILGIEVKRQLLNEYLYHFLVFNRDVIANQGQQGTQSNLNKGMVENIEIPLPTIEQQNEIVDILSDMDLEIAQLEEKLGKYKQVKQGLMQELLTGKIRLV